MNKYLLVLVFIISSTIAYSQEQSVSKDKAEVYFVRASGLGSLINFALFDGEKVIGRMNGMKYIRYECEPGDHLFWARSENKSYVEAELESGKSYLIDVIPQPGGLKAAVVLMPVDKNDYKLKAIQKLVTKKDPLNFDDEEIAQLQLKFTDVIERGMKRYEKRKENNGTIRVLRADMTIVEEDLVFVKKKKKKS